MKVLLLSLFVCLIAGCATEKHVAQLEGYGKRQYFPASYDATWRAAVDAAQVGGLQIHTADKATGYIAAHRGMTWNTHGENVGVWVKPVSDTQTSVEVVSRQAAPPKFWIKNWENDVLAAISANLTRDAAAAEPNISEPAGVEVRPAPTYRLPPRVVPEPPMPPAPSELPPPFPQRNL